MQSRSFNISAEKISLALVFIFFIALTFFSREIPFFWDGGFYSQVAHYYYENNFNSFILPSDMDALGSPMLSWMYLALVWKIFGKTLLISHLAFLPFLLGIAWEYYKLAKRFLHSAMIPWALLLLLLEPSFITQSIVMGYDIPKLYFYLLALNALLSNRYWIYSLSLCLLSLSSARGIIMCVSLALTHASIISFLKEKNYKDFIWYVPVLGILAIWSFYHYYSTGWFFFSDNSAIQPARRIVSFPMVIRQSIYIFWQIADFGRAFIWIFIAGGFFYLRKKGKLTSESLKLFLILLCPLLVFILILSPLSNPIGHRYFLILFLLSMIVLCYLLQEIIKNKRASYLLISLFGITLITGNFWIYRAGFSNGWDSSLKVLPYFDLKDRMTHYIKEQKIDPLIIGTKYPLFNDIKYSELAQESYHFTEIDTSINNYPYVLLSNISNQFTVQEKEILNGTWKTEKELHSGQVYIKLLKNPQLNIPSD